jgi:hypothetical protein
MTPLFPVLRPVCSVAVSRYRSTAQPRIRQRVTRFEQLLPLHDRMDDAAEEEGDAPRAHLVRAACSTRTNLAGC